VERRTGVFTDTIEANIGLGLVDRAHVEEAARTVEADRFIRELPDGYDTRLALFRRVWGVPAPRQRLQARSDSGDGPLGHVMSLVPDRYFATPRDLSQCAQPFFTAAYGRNPRIRSPLDQPTHLVLPSSRSERYPIS